VFKIFKNSGYILFVIFFFSLVITTCIYGSPQGYAIKANEKGRITSLAFDALVSKCEDHNTDMKEIEKAYKEHKEAIKISNKADIICEEKFFNSFKEDYYEYMSREQQKDIEVAYRAVIRTMKAEQRAFGAVCDAMYKLAKVDRSYYQTKKSSANHRIEKAKKHFDKVRKILDIVIPEHNAAKDLLFSKEDTIKEGDNIFTRIRKRQEENK
jgi:peptide methionine sulfoxide reductase MsrA